MFPPYQSNKKFSTGPKVNHDPDPVQAQVKPEPVQMIRHLSGRLKKQYLCLKCNKMFTDKKNYDDHIRRHAGLMHVCKYCSRCFASWRGLHLHLPQHTGIYSFRCGKCNKGFSLRRKLEKHEKKCQSGSQS